MRIMEDSVVFPSYINQIPAYVPGRPVSEIVREYGFKVDEVVKLASNENPLGLPHSARDAINSVLSGASRYPDPHGYDLKKAISNHYGVAFDQIVLGSGSDEILDLIAHSLLTTSVSAIYSQYSFAVYAKVVQTHGAKHIVTPATKGYGVNLQAMLEAIEPDTKLIFIANPNNPTGTFINAAELESFLNKVPANIVVVLDEAYTEFLDPEQRYDAFSWLDKYQNLVVTRTFSKAYGLAGLRSGFAVANKKVANVLNKLRPMFNMNILAQTAAIAVLDDKEYLERTYHNTKLGYKQITASLSKLGLEFINSSGNFLMVKVGSSKESGSLVDQELLKRGVITRPLNNYGLNEWLRFSIGLPDENSILIKALEDIFTD